MKFFSRNLWNEDKAKFEPGTLEISGAKISSIEFKKPDGVKAKQKILDLGALFVGPSATDLHVHSRDFNENHKESFATAAAAAAKGGVSTAVCMANTRPRLDSVLQISQFFKFSSREAIRFIPFAAATKNLDGKDPTDWDALLKMPIAGLSDDGKPILNVQILKAALLATKRRNKFVSLHEENTLISKGSVLAESETAIRLGIEGSPDEAEASMVDRDLKIAASVKAHIHFGHMSSKSSVELIRAAKRKGQSVSAELTPHHGLLHIEKAEELPLAKLSHFKVCPPIRTIEDQKALRKAVEDGSLDCFASDHAPHSPFEKDLPIDMAAHGLISLEYFFPLYNELRIQSGWTWKTFYSCMFTRPLSLLPHLKGVGKFKAGFEASFLVFDPLKSQELHWSRSRSSNTLFNNKKVRGQVFQHWISGNKIYESK